MELLVMANKIMLMLMLFGLTLQFSYLANQNDQELSVGCLGVFVNEDHSLPFESYIIQFNK
jgi:hypothetical protein